jgi:hypothetical protein
VVQDEHKLGSARPLGVVLSDPPSDRLGPGRLACHGRHSDLPC